MSRVSFRIPRRPVEESQESEKPLILIKAISEGTSRAQDGATERRYSFDSNSHLILPSHSELFSVPPSRGNSPSPGTRSTRREEAFKYLFGNGHSTGVDTVWHATTQARVEEKGSRNPNQEYRIPESLPIEESVLDTDFVVKKSTKALLSFPTSQPINR